MVIKGVIDEIRFRNEDNGYTIIVLDMDGVPVNVVGNFPPVTEGEEIEAEGDFVNHQKFGRQFKASGIKSIMPDTMDGLIRYLGSGLIKGVGPKTALAIANKFKEKTISVLENNPFLLSSIKGISKQKAAEIGEEFKKIKVMREAVTFLQGIGISVNLAVKIYKVYSGNTVAIVKTNPYRLYEDIDGVGFLTADRIAREIGISLDSDIRIRAGIMCALSFSGERNGNTFLPDAELKAAAASLLKLDVELIDRQIVELEITSKLKRVKNDETEGLMLSATFRAEKAAATKLVDLIEYANRIPLSADEEIAEFELRENIKLHSKQKEAVISAVESGVCVITGGPGTGKTTILKCILSIFKSRGITYSLMAPTGRAAKRLSESTGGEASTIHRALMLTPGKFVSPAETQNADAYIIDEFSMVDVFLLSALLSSIKTGAKLIIVGDKDQLPSVGAGNVLSDIISSETVSTVLLTEIYRQAEKSQIAVNAHKINNGEMPDLKIKDGDFFYIKANTVNEVADTVVSLACERIPKFLKCDPSRVQVLSPVKNGAAGTVNLNRMMQNKLNGGAKAQIFLDEQAFKAGDRVMHTANNYSLEWTRAVGYLTESGEGVFNGDIGIITNINQYSGEIEVLLEDNRRVVYTQDIRNQLSLAYAITVHKSQGSEFDGVIMPVIAGNPVIMTRNLLYTAITRAKRIVVLVGDEYNIRKMIDNNYIAKRYSMLKTFIADIQGKLICLYGDKLDPA